MLYVCVCRYVRLLAHHLLAVDDVETLGELCCLLRCGVLQHEHAVGVIHVGCAVSVSVCHAAYARCCLKVNHDVGVGLNNHLVCAVGLGCCSSAVNGESLDRVAFLSGESQLCVLKTRDAGAEVGNRL